MSAADIWTLDLTDKQLAMLIESGEDPLDGCGFGVDLNGAGKWATARSLHRLGLGWIEGGKPNGSSFPGLFFGNREAVRILHEFDDEEGS